MGEKKNLNNNMTDYPVTTLRRSILLDDTCDVLGFLAIMCAFFSGGIPGAIYVISFLFLLHNLLEIGCAFGAGLCGYLSFGLPGAICAIVIGGWIFDHNKVPVDNFRSSDNYTPQFSYRPRQYGTSGEIYSYRDGHYYNTFIQ